MRKVFLDELPMNGVQFNWIKSIGLKVKFIYNDINGEIDIIDYKKSHLYIKYLNYDIYKISIQSFRNCGLGEYLKVITIDFKYKIGEILKDDKRNLTVIDYEYRKDYKNNPKKWYNVKCGICGWNGGWIEENHLKHTKTGCTCCSGNTVVEGINDIPTTDSWMVKYFQGGYNEAKLYTRGSGKKIIPICPDCGKVKDKSIIIASIHKNESISCTCSDGISYPEKFVFCILTQLKLKLITQLSKTCVEWINSGIKYDFAILENSCIIETHGNSHYNDDFHFNKHRSLEEEKMNDVFKEQFARENGIQNYIVLDCRRSNIDWIKKSVMESKLPTLFNFTEQDIDWLKCHEYSLSNLVKQVCDYHNIHSNETYINIGLLFNISFNTVRNYLIKGSVLNWCNYDPIEQSRKAGYRVGKLNKKQQL